jgi:transcription elongation GreA/GreB family factor
MSSPLKKILLERCFSIISEKHNRLTNNLKELEQSAESESKSSMGDKYETGRAMLHLEREKIANQMGELDKMLRALRQINPSKDHYTVQMGSIVTCNTGVFFLSASLGKIDLDEKSYFAISIMSPIGQAMLGLKEGDSFQLNRQKLTITSLI